MIAAPGFVHGQWSVFLLGVLVLALFVYRRIESRSARQVRLGSSPINGLRWRTATICIAVLLMALSALRPFGGFEEVELRAAGRDIVAVVDVSNSMLAADVSPSRLSLVRRKLHDVLRLTLESGRRDRLGIIVFAGSAQLFCPLTADYTVLKSFINAISPELVVQGGSDLDSALDGAATIIEGLSASDPLVLVFSDGGDEPLDTDMLRRRFRDSTIPIVVFGVGTAEGGKIELEPGRLLTDWNGRVVVSRLAEDNLKAAAEAAGGRYFRARPDDGDLRSAFATASEDMPVERSPGKGDRPDPSHPDDHCAQKVTPGLTDSQQTSPTLHPTPAPSPSTLPRQRAPTNLPSALHKASQASSCHVIRQCPPVSRTHGVSA